MSIASEIERIQTAKTSIKTAIENKGVEVGEGTIDTYASKIDEISVGSNEVKGVIWTETDTDGYPIKVDASSVINTQNLFRYGDYVRTEEIILPTNRVLSTYYFCYANSKLKKINLPTDAQYYKGSYIDSNAFYGCKLLTLSDWQIPEGIISIGTSSFESAEVLTDRIIPSSVTKIDAKAFNRCYSMKKVTFLGTPTNITNNSFANCTSLTDIYCPWAEDEVANAPWGATNTTIHYNYTEEV